MEAHISLAVELIALALYAPFVVTVHEAGHAGFARIGGYRTSSFQLGMGRPFWRSELRGGAVLCVGPWLWLGGACTAVPTAAPSRRRIWFHAGGLIAQAAVVGVPDERLGEVGMAFVVPAPEASLTPEAVIAWCRDHMANYKVPRFVRIVDALPMNASGKVQKFLLRDQAVR